MLMSNGVKTLAGMDPGFLDRGFKFTKCGGLIFEFYLSSQTPNPLWVRHCLGLDSLSYNIDKFDCYFFLKGKSPAQVKLHYMYACLEYVSGK